MELMDAIYERRSVRKYKEDTVAKETIEKLLEIAVQAPSAMNSQPWAFAVIQDKELLRNYSDKAKEFLLKLMEGNAALQGYKATLANPAFNIFYNAGTFITIFANPIGVHAEGDCCLAAQNLMLAAHELGLGTCWIGFAQPLFNQIEVKKELGIPENYIAGATLIVGYPDVKPSPPARKSPKILTWK